MHDLRKIDALVAEKVMGLTVREDPEYLDEWEYVVPWKRGRPDQWDRVPLYSSSIAAAWEVVEKLKRELGDLLLRNQGAGWLANFYDESLGLYHAEHGETAPVAICLSALAAKGIKP